MHGMQKLQRLLIPFALMIFGFTAASAAFDPSNITHLNFAGLRQVTTPKPIWTIEKGLFVGEPLISPNGKWLLVTRSGDWYREGISFLLVDVEARKIIQNLKLPSIGVIGKPCFDTSRDMIWAVVNNTSGCALATWTIPDFNISVLDLGFGRAITAAWTHKQDKAIIMRDDGIIGVFETNGEKLLEVDFNKKHKRDAPQSIAITWDDKIVTSGLLDRQLCSWRITDGVKIESPPVQDFWWGYPVEYTSDNTKLLIASWHRLFIADVKSGRALGQFESDALRSLSYDPRRNLVAAKLGGGETFGVIDVNTGQLVMWARHDRGTKTTSGDVSWACLSPDGQTIYSGGFVSIKAWDLAAELQKEPDLLKTGRDPDCIALSPDRRTLNVFSGLLNEIGETFDTWDLKKRKLIGSRPLPALQTDTQRVIGGFTVDGKIFLIVSGKTGVMVFDTAKGEMTLSLGISKENAFSDMRTNYTPEKTKEEVEKSAFRCQAQVFPREIAAFQPSCTKDGKKMLIACSPNPFYSASIWSLETGKMIKLIGEGKTPASAVKFTDDGRKIIIGDQTGCITVYDAKTGTNILSISGSVVRDSDGKSVGAVDFIESFDNGSQIFASYSSGSVASWAWREGTLQLIFKQDLPPSRWHSLSVSPNCMVLAVCMPNGKRKGQIAILNAITGEVLKVLEENTDNVVFSTDNQLVTNGGENGIRIWSLDAKTE